MDPFLLHGWLMGLAWLCLLPAGVLIARFFKVTRGQDWPEELDNQFWWYAHRVLGYGGIGLATAGFIWIGVTLEGFSPAGWHALFGWLALLLGWLQVISAWLRGTKGGPTDEAADPEDPATWRGDHYDMSRRRLAFEAWHKHLGYLALALAVPAAWLGLRQVGAEPWLQALPWLALLAFVFLFRRFTRQGRRVDTYEAIWGPKPAAFSKSRNGPDGR